MFLELLFKAIGIFVSAIFFHELGHILMLREYNKKLPKIRISKKAITIGYPEDYIYLSKQQYMNTMLVGIVSGFIPLLFLSLLNFWLMFPIYIFFGCRSDIKNIIKKSNS